MGAVADRRGMRPALDRAEFRRRLCVILGGPRRLYIPNLSDTTTSTLSEPGGGSVITWDADTAARRTALRKGAQHAFTAASSQYGTQADADAQSFGNGSVDTAWSWVALINTSDTAVNKTIVSKFDNGGAVREYLITITTTELLSWQLIDQSAGVTVGLNANAAVPLNAWILLGGSYDGGGGATAANGMVAYLNGAVLATSPTNNASYVAMENLAVPLEIGSLAAHTAQFFQGSLALLALTAKNLSAAEHAGIARLCRQFYGVPL